MTYRTKHILAAGVAVLLLPIAWLMCSCGSTDPKEEDFDVQLYLPVRELVFDSDGGYRNMEVISSGNVSWEIKDLPEWLTASPMQSSVSANIRLTAEPNDGSERTADFLVESVSSSFPIRWKVSVKQLAPSMQ